MAGTEDTAPSHTSQKRQDLWSEWKSRISTLRSALMSASSSSSLSELTSGFLALYREVYGSKQFESKEALACISGRDCSPLELAFMWLGGWRPTSAIALVYSTLGGSLLEQGVTLVTDNIGVVRSSNALARDQLEALGTLQKVSQDMETHLSKELATLQMLVANQSMTEALATDAISNISAKDWQNVRKLMDIYVADLTSLFNQAAQLRLQTLEELVQLLSPIQCAHCCISAFELMNALKKLRLIS